MAQKAMKVSSKPARPQAAPALFRLLAESAVSRAALGCCAVPVLIVDALAKAKPVVYANAAFESVFGHGASEACGRPLAALIFRNDDALVQRLLEAPRQWQVTAWAKDGSERAAGLSSAAVRGVDGTLTHWVITLADRSEVERLRAELESLKALAASSLSLRLEPPGEPAGGAKQPRVEVAPAGELYPDRKALGVLQQR